MFRKLKKIDPCPREQQDDNSVMWNGIVNLEGYWQEVRLLTWRCSCLLNCHNFDTGNCAKQGIPTEPQTNLSECPSVPSGPWFAVIMVMKVLIN